MSELERISWVATARASNEIAGLDWTRLDWTEQDAT